MAWTPRVLVDFDGVIHRYSQGWADGSAYDEPVPGAAEALADLEETGYEIVVFSTRDGAQIRDWLVRYGFPAWRVTRVKEPAVCQIDDRAIRFSDWSQAHGDLLRLYPLRHGVPEV